MSSPETGLADRLYEYVCKRTDSWPTLDPRLEWADLDMIIGALRRSAQQSEEIEALKHDLDRHIQIASDAMSCAQTPTQEDARPKLKELLRLFKNDCLSDDETIEGIFQDVGSAAQEQRHPEDRTIFVLQEIARGRCDNGRPLSGETARDMARSALDFWPGTKK